MPHKESILGVKADVFTLEEALQKAEKLLENNEPTLVASINPEIIMEALAHDELKNVLNQADMALPDGVGIVIISWLKGGSIRRRVTGIDLMERLLSLAARKNYRVFFLGSSPGVAEKAAFTAQKKYRGLQVAGTHHGYFSPLEDRKIADKIAASAADMVFIGMGANRQEKFMFRYGKMTGARLVMVVGGSLDVLSGLKKRAPSWLQRLGLEWFYRVLQEPRRAKRIGVLPRFFKKALSFQEGDQLNLLDVKVDLITYKGALQRAAEHIRAKKPLWIVAINPEKIVNAWENQELRQLLAQSNLAIADGIGILMAGWMMGYRFPQRVTGVDLFLALAEEAAQKNWRVFFLGAAPGVAETAADKLLQKYEGLQVAGTHHGYFKPEEEAELVEKIAALRVDLLFVALGSPKQERFIAAYLEKLQAPVCMGVGGSFDVISGRVKRAPPWMQKIGMEWSYRLWREPRRALRMLSLPRFVFLAVLFRLGLLPSKKGEKRH